jgi:parallel beta-helix repeat protein
MSNEYGIYIGSNSKDNVISNNTIVSNNYGIYFIGPNNTLDQNRMNLNTFNLGFQDGSPERFTQNIGTSNTVEDKPIYYLLNEENKDIPPGAGFAAVVNSTRIIVKNLTLSNNNPQLLVAYSSGISVKDLTINGGHDGIIFEGVTNSTIDNATFSNVYMGILLKSSNTSTIRANELNSGVSVYLDHSFNNTIADNVMSDGTGIAQEYSADQHDN